MTTNTARISSGDKRLQWVPVDKMRISPRAQRAHDKPGSRARIQHIADNFDPDKFGTLTVSQREGLFWIIDGGHRYMAVLAIGWEDQDLQCWVYHGLSEDNEADKFLDLNNVKSVSAMDKFKVGVVAKRETECDIDRIVRAANLSIGHGADAIGCVSALSKTYTSGGPRVLATTTRVIRDAYGTPGFSAKVTEGVGLFVSNYENIFDEARLVDKLSHKHGGVNGLLQRAELIKKQYGVTVAVGVAAAAVETYNQGRGGNKLNGWWSTFNGEGEK